MQVVGGGGGGEGGAPPERREITIVRTTFLPPTRAQGPIRTVLGHKGREGGGGGAQRL